MHYDSVSDARMRLQDTVVFYSGEPICVTEIYDNKSMCVYYLKDRDREPIYIDMNDEHLDVSAKQLGYVNNMQANNCLFLMRWPLRRQKQGLYLPRCSFFNNENMLSSSADDMVQISEMLLNNYPTIDNALPRARYNLKAIALSYDVAISDTKIFFRTKRVGQYNRSKRIFSTSYPFLAKIIGKQLTGFRLVDEV